MKIKEAFDPLFAGVEFDDKLINKIERFNISYITSNRDIKDFMGSRLIGCFHLSYTQFDKQCFYEDVFGMEMDTIVKAIKEIKTIPKNFQIARDDINLICFYIAHRFLSNRALSKDKQKAGVIAIYNYFGYRTLVLTSSDYWKFPITRDKAQSVLEVLTRDYIITQVKNWNAYVQYRSESYFKADVTRNYVVKFDQDKRIPNVIVGLLNGYKSPLKGIYREFLDLEETDFIRSSKSVVTDVEGREVLMDRLSSPLVYSNKIKDALATRNTFIKREYLEVSSTILPSVSQDQLETCLGLIVDYNESSVKAGKEVTSFIDAFIVDSINYLMTNRMSMNEGSGVVDVVNKIVGNVLYARGSDITITVIKEQGEGIIKDAYKKGKVSVGERSLMSLRNAFCIYILILALL